MATTFERYTKNPDYRRGNYCTLPTIDVEIHEAAEHHCQNCGSAVVYDRTLGYGGRWTHLDATVECPHASPRPWCTYCNNEDGVTFHQRSYSDETTCTRCGGIDGYAIGD